MIQIGVVCSKPAFLHNIVAIPNWLSPEKN